MTKLVSVSTTWSVGRLQKCIDVDSISLVKLDCEGCEFELLPSLKWLFRKRSVRVVGEFHHWHLSQPGRLQKCIDVDSISLVKLDCEGCEFELLPSLKWLFRKRSVRVVGEFHHWHLSQPGHEANLSLHVARTSMRVLCDRNRASDRIEWLKKC